MTCRREYRLKVEIAGNISGGRAARPHASRRDRFDPFLGSGSMLIAANKTGRVCRGLELDPLYVDVIVRRYEAHSGEVAVLTVTNDTFEALTMRRARRARGPATRPASNSGFAIRATSRDFDCVTANMVKR